jgi:hypothetical protein
MPYGSMGFNFIGRKESIFPYVCLGFLVYPKNFWNISLKSQPGEFQ